jgi:hypothetical protein
MRTLALAAALALLVPLSAVAATTVSSTVKASPTIAGPTVDGKRASLAALRGKPVIVNVWSSW